MQRRGFLRLLGLSPVAAPLAAKEAVGSMVASQGLSVGEGSPERDPLEPDPLWRALCSKVEDFSFENEVYVEPDPRFESMKSWSRVYKHSEARKDFIARKKLRNKIDNILYSDMSIAEKTVRLAALGVK